MHYDAARLSKLIATRRPGYSLPAPFYLSDAVFHADLELIFGRHWIFIGVEPEAPEPGDYFTVELGPASIIAVRGEDMRMRAFHNVCRHRGSRLLAPGRGDVGNIVCPYHQWTYDLEGNLVHNEHMGEHFDRCAHGLRAVHLESLAGLLFICLADTPPVGFAEMRALMEPYLLPHDLARCKVAHQVDIVEAANWKLTMENNRECYHCRANHPQLTAPLHEFGFGYQPGADNQAKLDAFSELLASEHARWQQAALPCKEIEQLEAVTGFRTIRLPLAGAGESHTLDTKAASRRLLGEFSNARLGGLSFWTQPNSWHHFMSDHIVSFSVVPLDARSTLVRTRWLVHTDAVAGIDYDLERLTAVWQATNMQDKALVERASEGIGSPAYEPGPFSPYTEGLAEKFCTWYLARLATGLGNEVQ
jgi:Rieske 2Fe-2S family protein